MGIVVNIDYKPRLDCCGFAGARLGDKNFDVLCPVDLLGGGQGYGRLLLNP
ncbi:MAG: hypothetical protein DHS20C01_09220 [marine bacterium B5-7]|nr:MAG: hypothetical protein DHS20C01_09220 [marine bacterium B5-7]